MTSIGNRIISNIERPSKELVESFRDIPVANIDDCMARMGAMDSDIFRVNKSNMLGVAFTVRVPFGDNLMLHKAMDIAEPGDVIIIDAGGGKERAILGELMASYCEKRGISGIVVDGCIRDYDALKEIEMAVYARGITPDGPYKNGPGEINVPVSVGGKVVHPGDIVIGDCDGVIVVRPAEARELLEEVKVLCKKEENIINEINNKGTYIRNWVDEKLKEIGTSIE